MTVKRTRKQKIIRRTIWGTSLAVALAGALVWAGSSESGMPVAVLGGCFGLAGLVELGMMGRLADEGLLGAFVSAGLLTLLVSLAGVDGLLPASMETPLREQFAPRLVGFLALVPALVAVASRPRGGRMGLGGRMGVAALLAIWVGYPFGVLLSVWALLGHTAFVVLLVLSKIGDIAGYYVGNAIGKSHPFKGISPGKTTAGCVGSLVVAVVAAVVAAQLGWLGAERWAWASGLAFGLVINLAAQAGDLFESVVKRKSQVKDSGTWFGPSGGVLDLVDSLLFTVPAALFTWPLLFHAS